MPALATHSTDCYTAWNKKIARFRSVFCFTCN